MHVAGSLAKASWLTISSATALIAANDVSALGSWYADPSGTSGGLDSQSATALTLPAMYLTSFVYCDTSNMWLSAMGSWFWLSGDLKAPSKGL